MDYGLGVLCRRRCRELLDNLRVSGMQCASRGRGAVGARRIPQHERGGVLYEVAQPALSPLGQHGHRTLTPRPEPPLVQLRAAHGVKAGDARDKWQGTLYHALYTIHIHTYGTV